MQLIGKKGWKWLKIPSEFAGIFAQKSVVVIWIIVRKYGHEKWFPSRRNDKIREWEN